MGRRAKSILLVLVMCAALVAAFAVVLTSGSPGMRHAAGPGSRQTTRHSLTVLAEPQITYCFPLKLLSGKPPPTSFPTRGLAGCKRSSSSTKSGSS